MAADMLPSGLSLANKENELSALVIDVSTIQWGYFGLIVAFTICLALLLPLTSSSVLKWWLLSNLCTAAAMPLFILRPVLSNDTVAFLLPTTLVVSAAALKLIAVSSHRLREHLKWPLLIVIISFASCYTSFDRGGWETMRLVLALGVLSALTASIAYATADNRAWARLRGRSLLIISFATSAIFFALVALRSIIEPSTAAYFSQGAAQSRTFALNIVQVIAVHIGFIALMVGRLSKLAALKSVRQLEHIRRRHVAEQHAAEMASVAQERHALLELLSHEVRQPLHNAQAALQEISRQFGDLKVAQMNMTEPVHRLYDIIDGVVLALSNAIVGASVIERRAEQKRTEVDLIHILELAVGDCPLGEQSRIQLEPNKEPVFIRGDPVLLRLAVRNLLDNALKFSASGTLVVLSLKVDTQRFGAVIRILNEPKQTFSPEDDIFEREWRGPDTQTRGKGLGLFIVREVAHVHRGSVMARITASGQTCFEIFLPA